MTLLLVRIGPGTVPVAVTAPVNTVVPVISGTAQVGSTLSTTNGTWTGTPTGYTYQWKRGGTNISGATSNTYLLVTADLAATITVTVTASNSAGSASATSSGVGPVAAAPWTPASLTGLIGWWDMKVPGSITQSSGVVTNLADQSGAGNHLGDGSTTNKPTYSATGLNSLPAMTFNGSSQFINGASVFPMGTGNTLTIFAVATLTSGSQDTGQLMAYRSSGHSNALGDNASWSLGRRSTNPQLYFIRNGLNSNVATVSYLTPYRFIVTIDASGVTKLYQDGVAGSTNTLSANWTTGGTIRIGFDQFYFGGAIAEIGVATGFTNSTDVATLDLYLKNKWGL